MSTSAMTFEAAAFNVAITGLAEMLAKVAHLARTPGGADALAGLHVVIDGQNRSFAASFGGRSFPAASGRDCAASDDACGSAPSRPFPAASGRTQGEPSAGSLSRVPAEPSPSRPRPTDASDINRFERELTQAQRRADEAAGRRGPRQGDVQDDGAQSSVAAAPESIWRAMTDAVLAAAPACTPDSPAPCDPAGAPPGQPVVVHAGEATPEEELPPSPPAVAPAAPQQAWGDYGAEQRARILAAIAAGHCTRSAIVAHAQVPRGSIHAHMARLLKDGLIVQQPGDAMPKRFRLPPHSEQAMERSCKPADRERTSEVRSEQHDAVVQRSPEPAKQPEETPDFTCPAEAAIAVREIAGRFWAAGPTSAQPFEVSRAHALALRKLAAGQMFSIQVLTVAMEQPASAVGAGEDLLMSLRRKMILHGVLLSRSPVGWVMRRA